MPPKSTRGKNSKTAKENVHLIVSSKSKNVSKNVKSKRKALSDKTNSASDDNITVTSPKFASRTRKATCAINNSYKCEENNPVLIRRKRKLPERFVDNEVLRKLNRSKDEKEREEELITNQKRPIVVLTPLKTFDKIVEESIADSRPKRICRLPSKFDDHSISPNKYVPLQPIQASTPIAQNKGSKNVSTKVVINKEKVASSNSNLNRPQLENTIEKKSIEDKIIINKREHTFVNTSKAKKVSPIKLLHSKNGLKKRQKDGKETSTVTKTADTNNNANELVKDKIPCKKSSPHNINKDDKNNRIFEKEYSFKLFDSNQKATKTDACNLDIYEFTYDPTEEPPPQKKKRKRTVRKKQEKQKPVFTNNYNKNITKSLVALKNVLSAKTLPCKKQPEKAIKQKNCVVVAKTKECNDENKIEHINHNHKPEVSNTEQNLTKKNYISFHVEDIIVNRESYNHNEINYSPVSSPYNVNLQSEPRNDNSHFEELEKNNDPLNLQDHLSFFDENPAASSSLNVSTRNPNATPWRVEFGQLPIKWQANTYVKPNMTPAFESSFIVLGDKKKHVYTNIGHDDNEQLPEIVENDNTSKLVQTSIISFIKEVAEKNANKKLKSKSTPVKNNKISEDISNIFLNADATPEKQVSMKLATESVTPKKNKSLENITSSTDNVSISDKENSIEKNKKKDNDVTYFGFDESEEQDQENMVPNKKFEKQRRRALRPRSRAVLQELNGQKDTPVIPLGVKTNVNKNKTSNVDHISNDMAGKEPQCILEKATDCIPEITNDIDNGVTTPSNNFSQEDSQSVHLFEDLDVVHHVKPPRKSYVKQKRVAFRQNSVSSDSLDSDAAVEKDGSSAEEDDLHDLTFQMPSIKPKKTRIKKKSKKQLSKKEEKEVEAWAAGFNSMCEDIDEFDLVVE